MSTNTTAEQRTSGDPAAPTANGAAASREVTPQPEQKTVNLYTLDEFKKYQAARDKAEAERDRQYKAQLQTLQTELKGLKMRGLSETDQLKVELDDRNRALAEIQAEQERLAKKTKDDELKQKDIQRIVRVGNFTEEQVKRLNDATNYDEMLDMAAEFGEQNRNEAQGRLDANAPYIATGKPSTPATRADLDYDEAKKNRDGARMLALKISGAVP